MRPPENACDRVDQPLKIATRVKLGGHLYTNTLRCLFYFFGAHFAACASALRLGQLEDDHGGSVKRCCFLGQLFASVELLGANPTEHTFNGGVQYLISVVMRLRHPHNKTPETLSILFLNLPPT